MSVMQKRSAVAAWDNDEAEKGFSGRKQSVQGENNNRAMSDDDDDDDDDDDVNDIRDLNDEDGDDDDSEGGSGAPQKKSLAFDASISR